MAKSKNIIEIIQVQNSIKEVIQELYEYESRPNELIRAHLKNTTKLEEAIQLNIIEYDSFDDQLHLSFDTLEYYKTRLGQNDDTNIDFIQNRIEKLKLQLKNYNIRLKNQESTQKEIHTIYTILNQIPSLLKNNLHAIASNSIFAFKNESNFEIKMQNLQTSKEEIIKLIEASDMVDRFLEENYHFFQTMENKKINATILKLKYNSVALEDSFRRLYDEIKHYINQSIKNGAFIKKLQQLKQLKDENNLYKNSNIEEVSYNTQPIISNVKEKRLHPDDRIHDYIDPIIEIIKARKLSLQNAKKEEPFLYDIEEKTQINKALYNYQKLHQEFFKQEEDLLTFLLQNNIASEKLLGVFIRMLKNHSNRYFIDEENFITHNQRKYLLIYPKKRTL
ncbi:hypothetical protein MNB_SM-3-1497 [hydrothermal vent metagenome]|uniref:Uncharacterized protein n=1 Tax=hydrothermal vent metagenome TaxID=652676 RepID=A0A1W1D367_9ZZZZ